MLGVLGGEWVGERQGLTLESRVSLQERENDVCNHNEGSLLHGASDTTSLFPLIPCSSGQSVLPEALKSEQCLILPQDTADPRKASDGCINARIYLNVLGTKLDFFFLLTLPQVLHWVFICRVSPKPCGNPMVHVYRG